MNEYTTEVLDTLHRAGYRAETVPTGGGCEAVEVARRNGERVLITNGDAELPDGEGLWVGLYDADGANVDDGTELPHDMTALLRVLASLDD